MEAILFNIQRFCLHDGGGIRTTVFFKGCNLRCKWCANPESQLITWDPKVEERLGGRVWTLDEVVTEIMKDEAFYRESGGGVTLSGGEPLLQADFAAMLCDELHRRDITVGIETAANVSEECFMSVFSRLDFAQIDLKHWDDAGYRAGTGVGKDQILSNLRLALSSDIPVTTRIPVIPHFNDTPGDARAFAALLNDIGAQRVQLLPFHQMGEKKYEELGMAYEMAGEAQLHESDLEEYAYFLRRAGLDVQIGG